MLFWTKNTRRDDVDEEPLEPEEMYILLWRYLPGLVRDVSKSSRWVKTCLEFADIWRHVSNSRTFVEQFAHFREGLECSHEEKEGEKTWLWVQAFLRRAQHVEDTVVFRTRGDVKPCRVHLWCGTCKTIHFFWFERSGQVSSHHVGISPFFKQKRKKRWWMSEPWRCGRFIYISSLLLGRIHMKNLARAFIEIRRASSRHVETEYNFLKFLSLFVDQEGEKKTLNAFLLFWREQHTYASRVIFVETDIASFWANFNLGKRRRRGRNHVAQCKGFRVERRIVESSGGRYSFSKEEEE